ncbi:hypothetical protein M408DRAFT_73969, partial [Serendipita vermifera MAFF 305830]
LDFHVRRPGLVIFATIIAVVVNWLSTIFIFIMTCEGVIMRRTHVIQGPGLLAVCFTALFALPTVRSILPGAPDFGALNLVGVVPNVIIISVCTVMVSVSILRPRSRNKRGGVRRAVTAARTATRAVVTRSIPRFFRSTTRRQVQV